MKQLISKSLLVDFVNVRIYLSSTQHSFLSFIPRWHEYDRKFQIKKDKYEYKTYQILFILCVRLVSQQQYQYRP